MPPRRLSRCIHAGVHDCPVRSTGRRPGDDILSDTAETSGITLHTARSQLKSVMSKLGVSRESELVAMLSKCNHVLRREQAFAASSVGHA